jgi:hypothetical protein
MMCSSASKLSNKPKILLIWRNKGSYGSAVVLNWIFEGAEQTGRLGRKMAS